MGRAQHREAPDFPPIQQFTGDEDRFHGFSYPHIVGDEEPNRIQFESHDERHQLIGARFHGDAAERPKGPGGSAGGQARRIAKEPTGKGIAQVAAAGQWKRTGLHGFDGRNDAGGLLVQAADGTGQDEIVGGFGEHDPFATARMDQAPRFELECHGHDPILPKMSGWRRKISVQSSL